MNYAERGLTIHADCVDPSPIPFAMHDILRGNELVATASFKRAGADSQDFRNILAEVKNWLPAAAEVYMISSDVKDMVVVPVIAFPSDLPNRNNAGFPLSELLRFDPHCGCMGYKTFKGQPTHVDHKNGILSDAKGVIFDATLRPLPRTALYKNILLCAFDRNKDKNLVNDILTKKRTCYSMGANLSDYTCSICEASTLAGGCNHVQYAQTQTLPIIDGKVAYLQVRNMKGFELSSVETPAYLSAQTDNFWPLWNEE